MYASVVLILLSRSCNAFSVKTKAGVNRDRVIVTPNVTTIEEIGIRELVDADLRADMDVVQHKLVDVNIVTYHHQDVVSDALKANRSWDQEQISHLFFFFERVGAKGNFLDVGANLGAYTLPLAKFMRDVGSAANIVIAIEAQPTTAKHLRAGIKLNELDNIHLYEYAVTSPDGSDSLKFQQQYRNMGHSHVVGAVTKKLGGEIVEVPATTLDAILGSEGSSMQNIFAMKMDIEGSEAAAIEGALSFLANGNGPCIILIELFFDDGGLQEILERKGYVLADVLGPWSDGWFQRADLEACIDNLQ